MSLWDDVKSNLAEWYTVTSEKTSELARITTRRYDKFGISREIERQFSELGNFVYTGLKGGKDDLLDDQVVQDLVVRIQTLETELREKDEEIEHIRKETARKQESAGEESGADSAAEATDGNGPAAAKIITDPVLDKGSEDSAILVEPEAADPEPPEDQRI